MERQRGSLQIVRKFQNLDGSHVFDVMWSSSEHPGPVDNPILRRFSSEQELTDWLKKDMRRGPVEDGEDRVVIRDLQYDQGELRQFRLAA